MKNAALWVVFFAILIGIVSVFYFRQQARDSELHPGVAVEREIPAETSGPAIRYPIPPQEEAEREKPLPPLNESDPAIRERFAELFEQEEFRAMILLDQLIRRIVVTIDNLPRKELPQKYLPVRRPAGTFVARGGEGETFTISQANSRRYTPYVRLAESLDSGRLVSAYVHLYPLFQKAYEELGYPSGYFNDRLVEVLDHLLETPDIRDPVRLEQATLGYRYADPDLEKRSAGQKLLIRVGHENADRVKQKLRELRQEVTEIPRE